MRFIILLSILFIVSTVVQGFEIRSTPNDLILNSATKEGVSKMMIININTGLYNTGRGFGNRLSDADLSQLNSFDIGSLNPLNYYGGANPPTVTATWVVAGKYIQFDPTRTDLPKVCYLLVTLLQKYQ
ncbi:hypothetical protein PPL_00401 [Heterostelium album PN500]|uniref:Uncharacterized protein n=1 Tax=Heterostelium pallidum (strain ATCC 26659 / Pp 5 / PN500) TaxID=670386 RepID=D3AWC7_HETP5|nr:hypothetical protein PPL_00401 [Heterostelium album PN500]EFA86600.1 hypothetical protein PPL_00401 [Heterostelium album PN500]|eukprot:XP_020438705.1 hypothetical protein PPL_00401 [Heterostelium album PN500]